MIQSMDAFFESISFPMEPIPAYGAFHILYTLIGFALCGVIAWKLRKVSDRTAGRILFGVGLFLTISEVFKQLFYFFVMEDNAYSWGDFPFQLCSVPMYLCLIAPWLKPGKVQRGMYIMQYLDTKAAAYTMVECLLETAGVATEDLSHCWLSGAFPAHSDLESAITIGIFPDLPREKYTVLSNTSLEGARLLLLDRSRLQEVQTLAENIYCVQFASIPDFLIRMQAAKFIPHTDLSRYPSVLKQLH